MTLFAMTGCEDRAATSENERQAASRNTSQASPQTRPQGSTPKTTPLTTGDWPRWGRDYTGNMTSADARSIPVDFDAGEFKGRSEDIDPTTTKHVKWIAKLGSNTYGNPTVADGRVFVGTNNDTPRDPKFKSDRSNIFCLDEATGDLLWQLSVPKLGAGKVGDWEYLGICSSPTIDGDRVFLVSNRCEVLCLDVQGMANGNDGPFQDEGQYAAGAGKPPIEMGPKDADIIWRFDMAGEELGAFPHNVTSSSVLVVGDRVYANTSNGVDYSHKHIINPRAPALIVLDRDSGELVGEEASDISRRVLHGSWSSPTSAMVKDKRLIFFGAGDGICYAFDAVPVPADDGLSLLTEIWQVDCNPPTYRVKAGAKVRYNTTEGPSEIIATPVFHDGRVYVSIGQDPEHGEGHGALNCLAAGDDHADPDRVLWRYTGVGRAIATVSIAEGLLYVADYAGIVHCLDAVSGEVQWTHDTLGHIWGSTLVADGKVFVGNEDGVVTIFEAGRQKKLLHEVEFPGPIYSSPIVANGTLYIATMMHLYAFDARH